MSANPQDELAFHVQVILGGFRRKRPTRTIFGRRAISVPPDCGHVRLINPIRLETLTFLQLLHDLVKPLFETI